MINIEESYLNEFDKIKIDTLIRTIKHAPFTGWSLNTLEISLKETGNLKHIEDLFPNGVSDLTNLFSNILDKKLEFDVKNLELEKNSIRDRIKILLNLR